MEEGVGFGLTSSYSYCVVSGTSRSIVFHFKQQCESAVDIWHRNGLLPYKDFSHGLMPIYPSIACIHRYSKDYMISISLMPFSCQDSLPTQKCAVSIIVGCIWMSFQSRISLISRVRYRIKVNGVSNILWWAAIPPKLRFIKKNRPRRSGNCSTKRIS